MVGHLVVPVAFLPYTRTVVAVSIAVVLPLALLLALLLVPANNKTKKKIRKSARLRCVHEHVCDITKIIKLESYNHIISYHTIPYHCSGNGSRSGRRSGIQEHLVERDDSIIIPEPGPMIDRR